ncbi:cupin domain-containing protein [candidate division WOR-3 bacterium]|nr:cupin domain-containing protein [candidate division WOR-3 bacterium]
MITHKDKDITEKEIEMEGADKVLMRILIGTEEGSNDIIMRYFTIKPGGHTPRHIHSHPHIVKGMAGRGVIIDGEGKENELTEQMSAFVELDEEHQFKNPFDEDFSFLCIIPNPDK